MASWTGSRRTVQFNDGFDSEGWQSQEEGGDNKLRFPRYQIEQEEWDEINRELRHHGLPAVALVHPSQVSHTEDAVVLKQEISKCIRENILILMKDCDRRQALVQDLITTNNNLKDELERQTAVSNKYESRIKDLKMLVESSQAKIQELTDNQKILEQQKLGEEDRLRNTKDIIRSRNRQAENKIKLQEEEIERLKKKVRRLSEEEEKRVLRQNQVFQEFKRRTAKAHNAMDEKLLDIIDSYETQLLQLRKEVEYSKTGTQEDQQAMSDCEPSSNYKQLIRTYEKQLREAKKSIKKLEDQNELTKLDMDARPQIKDLRLAQHRIKKLERVLHEHNINVPGDKTKVIVNRKYSTQVDDLDFLPLDQCRKHLKLFCDRLGVFDLEHVVQKLDKNANAVEAFPRLEQFASDVIEITNSQAVPKFLIRKPAKPTSKKHEFWCEKTWSHVLPTLELWLSQVSKLKELQCAVNKVQLIISPSHQRKLREDADIVDMIELLDEVAEQDGVVIDREGREQPTQTMLSNVVQHFQNLFDVPSISGVFPRMNDIYVKLGEVHNVQRTLKDLLGLDEAANASAIVDSVGKLCQSRNSTTYQQLKQLLEDEDLDSVLDRLEQHDEFFPVFHDIISKVMDIVGVRKFEHVVPAVRALKLLNG